jgi:hypothetical protein
MCCFLDCHIFHIKMFNIVIIKNRTFLTVDQKYTAIRSVPSTCIVAFNTNELAFSFRANAYFAVRDITFLAKHPVMFFFTYVAVQ